MGETFAEEGNAAKYMVESAKLEAWYSPVMYTCGVHVLVVLLQMHIILC